MEENQLLKKALRFLGYRSRSRQELTTYLEKKTKEVANQQELIMAVLQRIEQFNLLNDQEFADQWGQSQLQKGKGPVAIRIQLKKKGISETLINTYLSSLELEDLYKAARIYLDKISHRIDKKTDKYKRKQYIFQALTRRGFTYRTINAVIDEYGG